MGRSSTSKEIRQLIFRIVAENPTWTRTTNSWRRILHLNATPYPTSAWASQQLREAFPWVAFALLVAVLIAVTPPTAKIVDYGAEGWLWALFGLCQRMYVDGKSASDVNGPTQQPSLPSHAVTRNPSLMPLLACVIAAVIYTWQEQNEFEFSQIQLAVFMLCLGILCIVLWRFRRGPSRIQPPSAVAAVLRFIGRHTLEIYAIELAGLELIIKVMPDLAP